MLNRLHKNCRNCPRATLKIEPSSKENFMYCQTKRSCIQLRKGWGDNPIPVWCPRLECSNFSLGKLFSDITKTFTKR